MPEGLNQGGEFTSPIADTNTPVSSSETQPTGTVSDFYNNIREQVTEETPQQIVDTSKHIDQISNEIGQISQQRNEMEQQKANTGTLQFRQKRDLNQRIEESNQQIVNKREELSSESQTLSNLTSPAQELNAEIASPEEVARTLDPQRLEKLAKANEPLQGQDAPVRFIDQTPEQRQQRLGKEYGSLPEDQRSAEQKDLNILEQQEEYKRIGVQKLVTRLTEEFQNKNQSIKELNNSNETYALWNTEPDTIQMFAERAYERTQSEEVLFNNDIERGQWSLKQEAKQIEKNYNTPDEENQIDYLKSRAKILERLNREAMIPMITWQLQNEIAQAIEGEPVNAEEFVAKVKIISENWKNKDERASNYLKKSNKYRNSLSRDVRIGIFEELCGDLQFASPSGTYFEGILQDIADISGKRADKLSEEDIPTILAYYNVALEEGILPVDYDNLIMGIESALQHVIKNPARENFSVKSVPELVRQIRKRDEIKGRNNGDFKDITKPYQHMVYQARAFDIHTNLIRR
jgi:hypothetical protein